MEVPDLLLSEQGKDYISLLELIAPAKVLEVAEVLKARADVLLHDDAKKMERVRSFLLKMAKTFDEPRCRALAYLVEANAKTFTSGEYSDAIKLFDSAAEIYQSLADPVLHANSQIGKVFALANLGQYEAAVSTAEVARKTFLDHGENLRYARLTVNLGILFGRFGEDREALARFDEAYEVYASIGSEAKSYLARAQLNRAIALRNLGDFKESLEASYDALAILRDLELKIDVAHAKKIIAMTYIMLARFNAALELLFETYDAFLADGRARDAARVDLYIADCLLELGRNDDVIHRCVSIQETFTGLGLPNEIGQALLTKASAYVGIRSYEEAQDSLNEAQKLFTEEGNLLWVLITDLNRASLDIRIDSGANALKILDGAKETVTQISIPYLEAKMHILSGRAYLSLGRLEEAESSLKKADRVLAKNPLPLLSYQISHARALLLRRLGKNNVALESYLNALDAVELMRSRVMLEFRSSFLSDKEGLFEEAMLTALDLGQTEQALTIFERAKSKALVELISYRLERPMLSKSKRDAPIIEKLDALRRRRDQLIRAGELEDQEESLSVSTIENQFLRYQKVTHLEEEIMSLWHRLLVQNASYASDAMFDIVSVDLPLDILPSESILLEYAMVDDSILLFLIGATGIEFVDLGRVRGTVGKHLKRAELNLALVPYSTPERHEALERAIKQELDGLGSVLIQPVLDQIRDRRHLIIVPNKLLHYLPFHALLVDGQHLIERYEVSYLPSATVLRSCLSKEKGHGDAVVMGWDAGGALPFAEREARTVARHLGVKSQLGNYASAQSLRDSKDARVIHLATHAVFRPDNPLFSGLAFPDGWLSTLDIFHLDIRASLVTLSACETGRTVHSAGDELNGLMRAFFAAGASSLIHSLWSVHDRSTQMIMGEIYREIQQGARKAQAIQSAQTNWLQDHQKLSTSPLSHPYYWAPFLLVGDFAELHRR